MTKSFTTITALALLASGAIAQQTSKPATDQPGQSPLAGPSVQRKGSQPAKTLVERDFEGKIKKIDVPPPEAAARLLDLDEAARKKIDDIITQRHAILDKIVADNLRLIVELAGARESGNREDAARLLAELTEQAQPLRDLGPLQRQIQGALTKEQVDQFVKLTQEYTNALVEEAQAEAKKTGADFKMREFIRSQILAAVGGEVRRSYERVVGQRAADFEALLKSLNLSQEQESKIRRIAADSFQKTYGKESPAERARVIALVFRELDEGQRKSLLKQFAGAPDKKDGKGPSPARPSVPVEPPSKDK